MGSKWDTFYNAVGRSAGGYVEAKTGSNPYETARSGQEAREYNAWKKQIEEKKLELEEQKIKAKLKDPSSQLMEMIKTKFMMDMINQNKVSSGASMTDESSISLQSPENSLRNFKAGMVMKNGSLVPTEFNLGLSAGMKQDPLNDKIQSAQVDLEKSQQERMNKESFESGIDIRNASSKIESHFDNWLDTVNRTYEQTKIKPGIVGGSLTKLLGSIKANEFYTGFKGGSTEYAAAVGRIAIPGARATRLIDLFKKTAPSEFDSVASGIQTTADSYRNALSTDMARNPEAYGLPTKGDEFRKASTEVLRNFEDQYKRGMYEMIYKKNPNLLTEKQIKEYNLGVNDKKVDNLLAELGF